MQAGRTVAISGVTLRDGLATDENTPTFFAGGVVLNHGSLTLDRVRVTGGSAYERRRRREHRRDARGGAQPDRQQRRQHRRRGLRRAPELRRRQRHRPQHDDRVQPGPSRQERWLPLVGRPRQHRPVRVRHPRPQHRRRAELRVRRHAPVARIDRREQHRRQLPHRSAVAREQRGDQRRLPAGAARRGQRGRGHAREPRRRYRRARLCPRQRGSGPCPGRPVPRDRPARGHTPARSGLRCRRFESALAPGQPPVITAPTNGVYTNTDGPVRRHGRAERVHRDLSWRRTGRDDRRGRPGRMGVARDNTHRRRRVHVRGLGGRLDPHHGAGHRRPHGADGHDHLGSRPRPRTGATSRSPTARTTRTRRSGAGSSARGATTTRTRAPTPGRAIRALVAGEYEFRVRTVDRAGNDDTSSVYSFTIDPALVAAPDVSDARDRADRGDVHVRHRRGRPHVHVPPRRARARRDVRAVHVTAALRRARRRARIGSRCAPPTRPATPPTPRRRTFTIAGAPPVVVPEPTPDADPDAARARRRRRPRSRMSARAS